MPETSIMRILVVDDELVARKKLQKIIDSIGECKAAESGEAAITKEALLVETASSGEEALRRLKTFPADIVITDVRMPQMDGLALLEEIRLRYPDIFVVIVTAYGNIEDAVRSMKAGAYDYILKPFDFDVISMVIEKITGHKSILQKGVFLGKNRRKGYRFENIIGQDPKMFNVFQMITDVSKTKATVLITGESGTGKELIADAIHYKSPRRDGPFIKVNCAALTETLVNSELFGHEKGAFTGATAQKKGHFELADGGTIFLDEIGDIPIPTQISLLRVLELGTFQRVGGTSTLKVDTRVVCATNKDLFEAIKEKLFREDLFYRINVVHMHVPPLRERKSDIPLLVNHFLKKYCTETEKNILRVSREAMEILIRYRWPGNVRELANVIENVVIFCKGQEVLPANLTGQLRETPKTKEFVLTLSSSSLPLAEATMMRKVLEETSWNLKQAAKELDIARGTLYSKMKKYGIEKPQ
ncbi:MAG: sigma-54-dependent Fis family transcriptional regulator [Desulfobacterales bacterium S3730MH5]|nr:MAG: sigma-54-dependent Fis family transcriptional regulator [Desulfobacterales bacterium S3730MH5]